VNFAAITLYVASQRVFIVVSVYSFVGSVWKLLDTPSYIHSPKTPSRRRAQLKNTGTTLPLHLLYLISYITHICDNLT